MATDISERDERRAQLAAFAAGPPRPDDGSHQQVAQYLPPTQMERHVGAQAVAVRRDEVLILQKLAALAAAAGDNWYYRFPVKNRKENRTDWIEGPSIKLANDLGRIYGNCSIDCRVQDLGDTWLFYARFQDFETGYELTRPFQQRKNASKMGGDDDARRLDIALQIGASKAIRNVTVNALQTFSDFAFEQAKNSLIDKIGKDLPRWRERVGNRLSEMGIAVRRAELVVGRPIGEWIAPDIAKIVAMGKAVADGMATADETFPPLPAPAEQAQPDAAAAATDAAAKKAEPKKAAKAKAAKAEPTPTPEPEPEPEHDQDGVVADGDAEDEGDAQVMSQQEATAYDRGFLAGQKGVLARAMPAEYLDPTRAAEAAAWERGRAEGKGEIARD